MKRITGRDFYKQLHQIADKAEPSVRKSLLGMFARMRESVKQKDLLQRVEVRDAGGILDALNIPENLKQTVHFGVLPRLQEVIIKAAEATAATAPLQNVIIASLDLTNPAAVEFIRTYNFDLITRVSDSTREGVKQVVLNAFEKGGHPYEQATKIKELIGLLPRQANALSNYEDLLISEGRKGDQILRMTERYKNRLFRDRARNIARTETIRASSSGQQLLWEQARDAGYIKSYEVRREWIVTPDDRACELCSDIPELNPEGVGLDEPFITSEGAVMMPPLHPSCLPGDSLVAPGGRISAVSKRWYQGDLIVICTARGKQLSCTPNHPVLTNHGWIEAGGVYEGIQLVSRLGRELVDTGDPNYKYVPRRVEEIADSFRVSPFVTSSAVMTSSPDFHGDGMDGEIAVIWADRHLRYEGQSPFREALRSLNFQWGLLAKLLNRFSPLVEYFYGGRAAFGFCVSCSNKITPLFLGQPGPPFLTSFADGGAAVVSADHHMFPLLRRHTLPSFPRDFCMKLPVVGKRPVSNRDAVFDKCLAGSDLSYPIPSCEDIERYAGQVILDKVVLVDRKSFSGHVYNLETETGWYVADGIITHNCRCTTGLVEAPY